MSSDEYMSQVALAGGESLRPRIAETASLVERLFNEALGVAGSKYVSDERFLSLVAETRRAGRNVQDWNRLVRRVEARAKYYAFNGVPVLAPKPLRQSDTGKVIVFRAKGIQGVTKAHSTRALTQ